MATRTSYIQQEWKDLPDRDTPISAERLTHIEQGIKEAADERALKEIYDDNYLNLGRKDGTQRGYPSAAFGYNTIASGSSSCATGTNTEASGNFSYAGGMFTKAIGEAQHVTGKYNISQKNYAEIIGGGTSDSDRKNIRTLDWTGNGWFAGDVTNGEGVSLNSLKAAINNMDSTNVPVATTESAGKVKPDGTTITIDEDGTIHAVSAQEITESVLGGAS